MRQRSKYRILKCIGMLIEDYIAAISGKFNLFAPGYVTVDRVEVSVHVELGVAGQAEDVRWAIVHEIGDRGSMAHLLKEISTAIRGVSLVGLTEDRVERLVPMVGGLEIGNATRDDHLHPFDGIFTLCRQGVKM